MISINPFESLDQKLDQIQADLNELKSKPVPESPAQLKFLTCDQVCEMLSISRVTLWSWDKKGITKPVRFGNLKRYRLSDIENLDNTRL